jgi:hypothetical protein
LAPVIRRIPVKILALDGLCIVLDVMRIAFYSLLLRFALRMLALYERRDSLAS